MKRLINTALLVSVAMLVNGFSNAFAAPLPLSETTARANKATAELKAAVAVEMKSKDDIVDMLVHKKFAEFEELSKKYQDQLATNPRYEYALIQLYDALDSDNKALPPAMDEWVKSRPSYMSIGARGIFKEELAYRVRGHGYAKDVTKAAFKKMEDLHREAIADLRTSIKQNAQFVPAYHSLVIIARSSGYQEKCKEITDAAVGAVPQTYYVRHEYLTCLTPRWGGSYESMQAFSDSLDSAVALNPRIWNLKGDTAAERGFAAMLDKDYDAAIKYYTEALTYGRNPKYLEDRGSTYNRAHQYALAIADMTEALSYGETAGRLRSRAIAYYNTQQYHAALLDYTRYQKYDSTDKDVNDTVAELKAEENGK